MSIEDKGPRMRRRDFLAAGGALALTACATNKLGAPPAQRGPWIDSLSFVDDPKDIAASGLDAFICDVSAVEVVKDAAGDNHFYRTFAMCDASIDGVAKRIHDDLQGVVFIALRGSDIRSRPGTATFFQFQSCEPMERDLSRIEYFYRKSLRVLQITHNESNPFGTSYLEERSGTGLTPLGIEGVAEMNRLGIIPDTAHGAEQTVLDVARHSKRPFIFSHGGCRALLNNPRCASDRMIRAVADSGGAVGIFMISSWLTTAPVPTPADYVAHIRHVVRVGGIDAVGISNDYQTSGLKYNGEKWDNARHTAEYWHPFWDMQRRKGVAGFEGPSPIHAVIPELNGVDRMERIYDALRAGGFRSSETDRIMGGNWARVLKECLK